MPDCHHLAGDVGALLPLSVQSNQMRLFCLFRCARLRAAGFAGTRAGACAQLQEGHARLACACSGPGLPGARRNEQLSHGRRAFWQAAGPDTAVGRQLRNGHIVHKDVLWSPESGLCCLG